MEPAKRMIGRIRHCIGAVLFKTRMGLITREALRRYVLGRFCRLTGWCGGDNSRCTHNWPPVLLFSLPPFRNAPGWDLRAGQSFRGDERESKNFRHGGLLAEPNKSDNNTILLNLECKGCALLDTSLRPSRAEQAFTELDAGHRLAAVYTSESISVSPVADYAALPVREPLLHPYRIMKTCQVSCPNCRRGV
jgi:hypothetical protein